jgi:predicted DCC family thiol-disulfide oxidoreductase YuxK
MKQLSILYDAECEVCRRCRDWLRRQPAFVRLEFIPLQTPGLAKQFPGVEAFDAREQLLVIADTGALYRGAHAWVMCLWALQDYRRIAQRMAEPILLPFARVACEVFSHNRYFISRLLFRQDSKALARDLRSLDSSPATPSHCGAPRACA